LSLTSYLALDLVHLLPQTRAPLFNLHSGGAGRVARDRALVTHAESSALAGRSREPRRTCSFSASLSSLCGGAVPVAGDVGDGLLFAAKLNILGAVGAQGPFPQAAPST
jgi:hypothetical protein